MEGVCLVMHARGAAEAARFCRAHPEYRCVAITERCAEALAGHGQSADLLEKYAPHDEWGSLHRALEPRTDSLLADTWSHFLIFEAQEQALLGSAVAALGDKVVCFGGTHG